MNRLPAWFLAASFLSAPAWSFTLIKNDEARLPAASGLMATRGISRGPGVKVLAPDLAAGISSPFNLKIAFEPRGGAKIDPTATKVTYLKATPVDLLPRVKAGLSEQGLVLEGAETPPGEHAIQISVQDSEGRVTNTVIQLNVVK
jgi:hypothetical protein